MRNFTKYIFYTFIISLRDAALSKYAKAALALCMLINISGTAVAQVRTFNPKREYNRPYTAVADNTRVVIPAAQIQKINQRGFEASKKIQAVYDKKQADEARAAANLKATYKYTEFDKTGYLTQGQWSGKRKDGSVKNTGFFGEIVIQGGKYRGKVITEASVMIKRNGKEVEVPLLNPYLSPRDIEVLRYGNINANIIKSADYWLQHREAQRLSPFAQGKEIAEKSKWAYNDITNMLQVSFFEVQKQKDRRASIAVRIKHGEKNPYIFGADYEEWKKVEAEVNKQIDKDNRVKAVMASNPLFTKQDAEKQVTLTDEEYAKNEVRIEREIKDNIRAKIRAAQQAAQASNIVVPFRPAAINKYLSVEEAVSSGLITNQEINNIRHKVAGKYINNTVQAKFSKYITDESGHNTANLGIWGSMKARTNYFLTYVQNTSIIGKASLGLWALGEGLVTWKNPSKIYQRDYQRNQQYLDYYNMGTKWGFVDEIALTVGAFGADAGVFKVLGMASAAVTGTAAASTATSTAAKIILPSVQTGLVLGTYDGLNTLGDALGYKDFGKLNSNDWGKIAYNTGRGFTSGVIVGQYGRMIWGNQVAQKTLAAPTVSKQIANGARHMGLGMSEGAVFSVSGAAYDQVNSTWLPAQGTPNYIGGNSKAFAQMTPTSLLKDMVKFYFAIKLPGNAIYGAESNGGKVNTKKAAPVRKSTIIPETNSTVKPEVKTVTKEAVSEDVTPIKKGTYVIEESAPGVAEVKFKWMLENEPVQTLNKAKTLTQQVGEGSGGSAEPVKTTQEVKTNRAPLYTGYQAPEGTPIKVYQPKPLKIVDNARVEKAYFRAGIDQTLSIFNQIARGARTRFGAIMLSTALSLSNPVMLNAAESGKVMPMVEMLAGTESVNVSKGLRSSSRRQSSASAVTPVSEAVKTPQVTPEEKITPVKALPDYKPLAAAAFVPLAFPKYATFGTVKDDKSLLKTSLATNIPYTLQTKEEAARLAKTRENQFVTTRAIQDNLPPYKKPLHALAQTDPVLPIILLYTMMRSAAKNGKKAANQQIKAYKDLNSPASGFFGANIELPKGYDKKKGVETYYIDADGQEIKLPLLFNIDKGIKVNNSQRGVFNEQNRLEIRNGGKKTTQLERFCMLLENTAKAKLAFVTAVKNAALATPFKLKLQFTDAKVSRHYKEVPLQTAGGKGMSYINLLTPRNMIKEGEILTLNKDGSLTAVNKAGDARTMPDFTLRVPKGEIEKLVKVLTSNSKKFVMDIVPTQNKTAAFTLSFLAATTIMAAAPSFKEMFNLGEFWANTIMGIISFGPALCIPLFGSLFKKFGVTKVLKGVSVMSLGAIALTTLSGFYGFSGGHGSTPALIGAIAGLFMLSLSNEIKFSSMSPVIETNFDGNKALAVTTKALMARSLGTIFFLQIPALYNLIASKTGLPHSDETISFALFLLPVAVAAVAKMLTSHLREVPALPENDIGIKNLIHIFKTNKEIRNGALAFTMFESIEATLSLLVFSLAKDFYGPLSSVPNVIGGVAIYTAMVLSRFIASNLQKKGTLNAQQTLAASFGAITLGSILFASCGISAVGLGGAGLAFMGAANTFAPLYNVTSQRNPNKSSEISLIFFTTTTLAALSTTILGAVMDATGSQEMGFIVPFAAILGALYLSKYVFKDSKLINKLKGKKASAAPAASAEKAKKQNKGPNLNNPQPQN